jgi:hypothetical protein
MYNFDVFKTTLNQHAYKIAIKIFTNKGGLRLSILQQHQRYCSYLNGYHVGSNVALCAAVHAG